MTTYQEAVSAVSAGAEQAAAEAWHAWQRGALTDDEFQMVLETILAQAGHNVAVQADLALADRLGEKAGYRAAPTGVEPKIPDMTLAVDEGLVLAAVLVEARAVTRQVAVNVWADGLRSAGVPGWRRAGGSCPVCARLSEAEFIPAYVTMWTHRGDNCHPDPILQDPQGDTRSITGIDYRNRVEDY